jgi:hypothetical protein
VPSSVRSSVISHPSFVPPFIMHSFIIYVISLIHSPLMHSFIHHSFLVRSSQILLLGESPGWG